MLLISTIISENMNQYDLIQSIAELSDQLNLLLNGKHILIRMHTEDKKFTIFQKSIEKRIAPASTVKIFLLDALLKNNIDNYTFLKVEKDDMTKGSGYNLKVGEEYYAIDLIKNLMIASSNTSARVLRKKLEKVIGVNYFEYINQNFENFNLINEHGLGHKYQYVTLKGLIKFLDEKVDDQKFKSYLNYETHSFSSKLGHIVDIKNTYEFFDKK